MSAERVVIMGEGVAAIKLAREIAKDRRFDVELVSESNHFRARAGAVELSKILNHTNIRKVSEYNPQRKAKVISAPGGRLDPTRTSQKHPCAIIGSNIESVELAAKIAGMGGACELIEAEPRILPHYSGRLAAVVEKKLKSLGVLIYTSTLVKASDQQVRLPNGTDKDYDIIWATKRPRASDVLVSPLEDPVAGAIRAAQRITGSSGLRVPRIKFVTVQLGAHWAAVSIHGLVVSGFVGWLAARGVDFDEYRQIMPLRLAVRTWVEELW